MKAVYFTGKESFELREVPKPVPGEGEVLIRNKVCGVCGTDVHIYFGEPGSAEVSPPVVLGHEYSGIIEEVGAGVKALKPGDRVTVDPNIYCGECVYCRDGKKQLCENMQAIGVTRDGGFEEYSVVPKGQAFLLKPEIPFEIGAMAEPLACCLHGIDRAEIRTGSTVCIVGGGAIGLIMLQLAKLSGAARVILSEPNAMRREVAESLGASLTINPQAGDAMECFNKFAGAGADVVIECAGNNSAVAGAFSYAKKGATVVLFSVPKIDTNFPLHLFDVYKKELTVKGSFVNPDTHQRAVAMLNAGLLDFSRIITHRFGLDDLPLAIKTQMGEESIKVVVES